MTESDLRRLERAWRDAPDADVARALSAPDDYDAEALPIIQREAARRNLARAEPAAADPGRAGVVHDTWSGVARFLAAHRYLAAGGLGAAVVALGGMFPWDWLGAAWLVGYFGLLTAYVAGLAACAWPLVSYRLVIAVTFAGQACAAPARIIYDLRTQFGTFDRILERSFGPAVIGGAAWGVFYCVILCGVVWVRKRYWPVYGPGCCVRCGYDLRGQVEPRCPECGEAFDRAPVAGAEKVSG